MRTIQSRELGSNPALDLKGGKMTKIKRSKLLVAESILKKLYDEMTDVCRENMTKWPQGWMQKNVSDRAAILKVRNILLDQVKMGSDHD